MKRQVQSEPESGRPGLNRRLSAWEAEESDSPDSANSRISTPRGPEYVFIRERSPSDSPTIIRRLCAALLVCTVALSAFCSKQEPPVEQTGSSGVSDLTLPYMPEFKNQPKPK